MALLRLLVRPWHRGGSRHRQQQQHQHACGDAAALQVRAGAAAACACGPREPRAQLRAPPLPAALPALPPGPSPARATGTRGVTRCSALWVVALMDRAAMLARSVDRHNATCTRTHVRAACKRRTGSATAQPAAPQAARQNTPWAWPCQLLAPAPPWAQRAQTSGLWTPGCSSRRRLLLLLVRGRQLLLRPPAAAAGLLLLQRRQRPAAAPPLPLPPPAHLSCQHHPRQLRSHQPSWRPAPPPYLPAAAPCRPPFAWPPLRASLPGHLLLLPPLP